MSTIEHAILGFLSWKPMSGYDLKKLFSNSLFLHWSGNNNQIYRSLVKLHKEGLVDLEVQGQGGMRPRKVYTTSKAGMQTLRDWVQQTPELPQIRNAFLVKLAWADQLEREELEQLIAGYESEVELQLLMARERLRRGEVNPARSPREKLLWELIGENRTGALLGELTWIRQVRRRIF